MLRTAILHLFLTGIPYSNTIGRPEAWEARYKAYSDYLDQTFTGKLITACRTHDVHPLEHATPGAHQEKPQQSLGFLYIKTPLSRTKYFVNYQLLYRAVYVTK